MTSDDRVGPPSFGSERQMLRTFLDFHRGRVGYGPLLHADPLSEPVTQFVVGEQG